MTWLKTDDRFPEHRKIRRLSDSAYRLHHTAMCACAKDETDGLVTDQDVDDMEHGARLRKHIPALVAAGLWEPVPGGWIIHDFLHYNPSHGDLEEKRRRDRERQHKWRQQRDAPKDSTPVTNGSHRDNTVTAALSHHPVPSRPDPSRPVL